MSYQRALLPCFYCSLPPYYVSRGNSYSHMNLQAGTLNSGSSIYDLIDGKPLKRVSFDTSGAVTTKLLIRFDFGVTSQLPINFVAVLNHNFATASAAKVIVRHHTSAFTSVTDGTAVTITERVGASTAGAYTADGSMIGQFPEVTDKRYWAVVIEYTGLGFSGTDLEIGQIMLGRYFAASAGPEVQGMRRGVGFDGVSVERAEGGGDYGTASWVTAGRGTSSSFGQPFHTAGTTFWRRYGGRRQWRGRMAFVQDTEAFASDISSGTHGDSFEQNVIQRTAGGLIPLVFTPNSASADMGDYIFARIGGIAADYVAHNVVSYDVEIEETW